MPGFLYWCWEYKQVLVPVWQALTHWAIFLAKWPAFKYWKCSSLSWSLFSLTPPLFPLPFAPPPHGHTHTHKHLCGGGFLPGLLRMPLSPFSNPLTAVQKFACKMAAVTLFLDIHFWHLWKSSIWSVHVKILLHCWLLSWDWVNLASSLVLIL